MLRLKWDNSVRGEFAELGIFTVFGLDIYELLIFAKNLDFCQLCDIINDSTRNKQLLSLPQHSLELFETKPFYTVLSNIINLPIQLENVKDVKYLNQKLKHLLLSKLLYSLLEFFMGD